MKNYKDGNGGIQYELGLWIVSPFFLIVILFVHGSSGHDIVPCRAHKFRGLRQQRSL